MIAKAQPELIDRLMDMYVEWREECVALWNAYETWRRTPAADRDLAFAAYKAALDREEWASFVYAELVDRIRPSLDGRPAGKPAHAQRLAACIAPAPSLRADFRY